ncbi:MAG: hypothetical protein IPJ99_00620 [Betaproteobacteria bacterium]|nr:hypothetical protein [Betaproteobacteria bacterium]MBK8917684.1 hypothetical protein [Betaproteobacteria bacterium]
MCITGCLGYREMIARFGQFGASQTSTQAGADLVGGAMDDTLVASGGGSTLRGGRGDDVLIGNGGNNTYAFEWGDGRDRLVDTSPRSDATGTPLPNTLRFDAVWLVARAANQGSDHSAQMTMRA